MAFDAARASEPGTALWDGMEVVDGSVLVGPAMPLSARERGAEAPAGFQATLLVVGDPAETLNRVLAEAARAGIVLRAAGGLCAGAPDAEPMIVDCRASTPIDDDFAGVERLHVSLHYGRGHADGPPQTHITMSYLAGAQVPVRPSRLRAEKTRSLPSTTSPLDGCRMSAIRSHHFRSRRTSKSLPAPASSRHL